MVSEAPTLKVPIPVGHNPRILADTPILAREAIPPREAILIQAREAILIQAREAILIRAREDIRTRVTQEPDTALIPTIVRVTIRMHRTRAASSLSFYAGSLAYWASTVFTLGRPELE